ncbi:hypothetical protein HDF26_002308 [Pedobacter cryoconitis]|uniref:hypothetical protein n=1 Tax=Pedobacter cryoconitis TaxID=188932 RepID=UPI0016091710|nr:hypothetical protein [Pedobacter cryoconitis]MBB6271851.1 hypothetical protein [Pedobacter cryoconitis]
MGLFWKKRRSDPKESDQIAEKLAFWLLKVQRDLAERINVRIRKIKMPVLLAIMTALGSAFGIYCIYLILRAFF